MYKNQVIYYWKLFEVKDGLDVLNEKIFNVYFTKYINIHYKSLVIIFYFKAKQLL